MSGINLIAVRCAAAVAFVFLVWGAPMSSDRRKIDEAIHEFIRAYNAGDVDRLLTVYAGDFVDMSEGEPTLQGEQAHRDTAARLRDTFAKFNGNLTVHLDESKILGAWAFDRGTLRVELRPKGRGEPVVVERRFVEIWRRETDGQWKVAWAMDNSGPKGPGQSLDFRQ